MSMAALRCARIRLRISKQLLSSGAAFRPRLGPVLNGRVSFVHELKKPIHVAPGHLFTSFVSNLTLFCCTFFSTCGRSGLSPRSPAACLCA